jgi:hypothetical protein
MISMLVGLVAGRWLQLGIIAAGLSIAIGSCALRDRNIEARGAEKQSAKIEKANSNATRLGTGAARKSRAAGVRGVIDPTTRND